METTPANPARTTNDLEAVLSSTSSDSHTWNLIFIQLLMEEHGYRVSNLGPCVPPEMLVERCRARPPALVVLSSVNGHGYLDGAHAVHQLREVRALRHVPVVIGGKLGIRSTDPELLARLRAEGFDAAFDDSDADLDHFRAFLRTVAAEHAAHVRSYRDNLADRLGVAA